MSEIVEPRLKEKGICAFYDDWVKKRHDKHNNITLPRCLPYFD